MAEARLVFVTSSIGAEVEKKMAQVCCTPSSYFSSYLFSKPYAEMKDDVEKEISVKDSCG